MQFERRGKFYTVDKKFSFFSFICPPLSMLLRSLYLFTVIYFIIFIILFNTLSLEYFLKIMFFVHLAYGYFTFKIESSSLKRRGYTEFNYKDHLED